MLQQHPIIAFVATNDAARARSFYENVLGLTLREDSPFALVFDAGGVMLRIQKTRDWTPPQHTALGWHVPVIADSVHALAQRGVRFERFAGLQPVQDELGIWHTPDGTQIAWFKDPDGNLLSLTQFGA